MKYYLQIFVAGAFFISALSLASDEELSNAVAMEEEPLAAAQLDILPPEIVLQDIALVSLDLQAAKISVVVNVKNPNDEDVIVESIEYTVVLNESPVKQGAIRQEAQFPAKTSRTVRVPVTLVYDDKLPEILAALNNPSNSVYEISGMVNVKGRAEPFPFYHKDKLVMPKPQS